MRATTRRIILFFALGVLLGTIVEHWYAGPLADVVHNTAAAAVLVFAGSFLPWDMRREP